MPGPDPALPDLRFGVNPRFWENMPQQDLGAPQFWDNSLNINYWPVYGYPPHVNMPQRYGGNPPQLDAYVEPQPAQPLYGNIYYEGHILPDYNQNVYVQCPSLSPSACTKSPSGAWDICKSGS